MTRRRRNRNRWLERREHIMFARQVEHELGALVERRARRTVRATSFPVRLFVALAIEQAAKTIPTEPGQYA